MTSNVSEERVITDLRPRPDWNGTHRLILLACLTALVVSSNFRYARAGEIDAAVDGDKGLITVKEGDRVRLQYQCTPAPYKVYVKQWSTPGGLAILRDSPHDHVHHHALMYAVGVDGVDFWGENPNNKPGRQVPRGEPSVAVSSSDGRRQAKISQTIDWTDADGNQLLLEQRTITLDESAVSGASLLQWRTRFTPAQGRDKAQVWGRHYFGLGVRFVQSMDGAGTFVNSTGKTGENVRGTELVFPADWCAYTAPVDGKPVTVAMFGHPENFRHPTTWFTMTKPFAYISATLNLKKEPLDLTADKPLDLSYAAVLWDGEIRSDEIARAYTKWIELMR